MARKKVFIDIQVSSGAAKQAFTETGTAVDRVKTKTDLYAKTIEQLTEAERRQLIEERKSAIQKGITARQIDDLAMAEMRAADATNAARAQSGLNNAILIETSRLASDANYGFTAMANNLGQIATLFAELTRTAGGFRASMKQLVGSLIGTGGILIAIQLLISFAPKLYEFFNKAAIEAEKFQKKMDEATESIRNQIAVIEQIIERYRRLGRESASLQETVALLSEEFPDFATYFEGLESYDTETVNELINNFLDLQKAKKEEIELQTEFNHLDEERIKLKARLAFLDDEEKQRYNELNQQLRDIASQQVDAVRGRLDIEDEIAQMMRFEGFADEAGIEIDLKPEIKTTKEELIASFSDFYDDLELKIPAVVEIDAEEDKDLFMLQFKKTTALEAINIEEERMLAELEIYYQDIDNELFKQQEITQIKEFYADKRNEIQQNELDILADATHAISQIFGEQTAMHKAFAISTALIDTYTGANKALTDETIPNTFARIAAVTAVIATGIANVVSIMDVDERGTQSVTTGRGGRQVAAPAFNIVGTSPVSQLGTSIAAQAAEPTRAYVVFKDIQNAEEWDTTTNNRITLG